MRILALVSQVLGNRAFSQRLIEGLKGLAGIEVTVVSLDSGDYRSFPAPRLIRRSGPLESNWVFRSKLKSLSLRTCDAIIANGYGLLEVATNLFPSIPAVLATDTTPALQFRQKIFPVDGRTRMLMLARQEFAERAFRKAIRNVVMYMPLSKWCAASLRADYKVMSRLIHVTSAPQSHILDELEPRRDGDRLRLLFVGNDFARKGGEFLLSLFEKRLRGRCELTIVSNDDSLAKKIPLPHGVELVSGLREIADIRPFYRAADLLILPTSLDQYSQVLCEGFAQGLPCIASAIGGIPELVAESGAGILLPDYSPARIWADKILSFAEDYSWREQARNSALNYAKTWLGMDRFRGILERAVDELSLAIGNRNGVVHCGGAS